MREDIKPGATLPDFELPDHTDTPRKSWKQVFVRMAGAVDQFE